MLEQVRLTLQRYAMIQPGDRVIVAVSGGADSVALTLALAQLAPEWSIRLHLFHLHHGLRGDAADADAVWVRDFARQLGIPCTIRKADVGLLARKQGKGLEEAGRTARYQELAALAAETGAQRVATGHTRDDQAETVLLRLLRGTGTTGLAGIHPVRPLGPPAPPAATVVRPLLAVSRQETEAFCAAAGITPRTDMTNLDRGFARNRIRHDLLPVLKQFSPAVVDRLAELAEIARAEDAFLSLAVEQVTKSWGVSLGETEVIMPREALWNMDLALARRLVRLAARHLGAHLNFRQVEAVLQQSLEGQGVLQLPRGLRATVSPEAVTLSRGNPGVEPAEELDPGSLAGAAPLHPLLLAVPGVTPVPGQQVAIAVERLDRVDRPLAGPEVIDLDPNLIPLPLMLRTWRPGDRVYLSGMSGSKKLQDLFVDLKIPRSERKRIPLVVTGENLVWVVGLRADRRFLASPGGPALRLRAVRDTARHGS